MNKYINCPKCNILVQEVILDNGAVIIVDKHHTSLVTQKKDGSKGLTLSTGRLPHYKRCPANKKIKKFIQY